MQVEPQEDEKDDERSSRLDSVFRVASLIAAVALAYLAGGIMTASGTFPGPQIAAAYEGGKALYSQFTSYQNIYGTDLWYPQRGDSRGVTIHVREKVQDGLTLFTSGHAPAAYLIDMDGHVVHEWRKPFSEVWPDGPDSRVWQAGAQMQRKPQPDPFVYFRKAHVFPNGDLLALYEGAGDTPYGYGLVKLDKDSNVLWRYAGRAHHQFDVGPDGRIYVLTHAFSHDDMERYDRLKAPRLDDYLVVLSADGEELQKIRLLDAVADSPFRQLGYTVSSYAVGEPLHVNSVTFLDGGKAAALSFAKEGQVLLSFRELGTGAVAILDLGTERLTWATLGPWIGQHDPDPLPNGNILLFDNFGRYQLPGGHSRILEFNPETMEIVWQYAGTPEQPLESPIRGDQQRLANGNTLIDESSGGRLVEVTRAGEIVWEFFNPVTGGPDGRLIPIFGWAERLTPAELDPAVLRDRQQAFKQEAGD
ncbi:MAG: arylsulfotransferase family protein [Flavobacteriaceae bacterium]